MGSKALTLHDLPAAERPRERLQKFGADNLSSQELLALILGRGTRGEPVMVIAQKLLSQFGSLENIVNASLEDLQQIRGLGLAKAAQLKACLEIARRVITGETNQEKRRNKSKAVASPEDLVNKIRPKIANKDQEHLVVVSFDNRNRILGYDIVSVGTLNANLVHPRETFNAAIKRHAASIIIVHNHPSGDPEPSEADKVVTKRLAQAGELIGIQLLDHIIISKTLYFSFRQKGAL